MNLKFFSFKIALIFFLSCQFSSTFGKDSFLFEDKIYDPNIKSVLLYSGTASAQAKLSSPVVPLGEDLLLEFDELVETPYDYAAKIYNCTQDWKKSDMSPLEYLYEFNEFYLTAYEASFNTKVKYIHYKFPLPKVKISGNFVIKIYPRDNEDEPILTRCFMVYEEKTIISSAVANFIGSEEAFRLQQIDLNIHYQALKEAFNPAEQIRISLRQNTRRDNEIALLKPTAVRDFEKRLDFVYLNKENTFSGGNEFRIADIRNLNVFGITIDSIYFGKKQNEIWLRKDASRKPFMYNRTMQDLNGRFYIDAFNVLRAEVEADYLKTHFFLKSPAREAGRVYVRGAFNDFSLSENYELKYDEKNACYSMTTYLKQGLYDYFYTFVPDSGKADDDYFEGTFSQTQNDYEVFVYFRPQGSRGDFLVGYKKF